LSRRLANLGISGNAIERLFDRAQADASWRALAALDAATRMVESIAKSGGLRRGRQTAKVLELFFTRAGSEDPRHSQTIPKEYWSVSLAAPDADGEEQLLLRGAVLLRISGCHADRQARGKDAPLDAESAAPLSPELAAALAEKPTRPVWEILRLLRDDGLLAPAILLGALGFATAGVVIEALLLRGLLDLGRDLGLTAQRLGALGALLTFIMLLLLFEFSILGGALRLGRHLESRLRMAFLHKIPRLADRYFQSRLTSDMSERSHAVHLLRSAPELGARLIRAFSELTLTVLGIIWLEPRSALLAIMIGAIAVGIPLFFQPMLAERDLRIRNHVGALSRFYFDALLGLVAIRAHKAERALRGEHESLLVEWAQAGLGLQRAAVLVEGLQSFGCYGLTIWLLMSHLTRAGEAGAVLLLIYWALNLPALGQEINLLARQYPALRNITLRLVEPLGAAQSDIPAEAAADMAGNVADNMAGNVIKRAEAAAQTAITIIPDGSDHQMVAADRITVEQQHRLAMGMAKPGENRPFIAMQGVSVKAAGHIILESIDLSIKAGEEIAIVGSSGAGKSSLAGLLLGWHRPADGQLLIDGAPLDDAALAALRSQTAWIDPAVQLWNRPLLNNLNYGAPSATAAPLGQIIEQAELRSLLEKLPDGLQTPLGESGALVSGGEGQRVRFGRALLRPAVKLIIMDEPFRGLDRETRRELLARARRLWRGQTLLCITHDLNETRSFPRVIVIEGGRIVADGRPDALVEQPDSRYQALLHAEAAARERIWSTDIWQRWRLEKGALKKL
jgi:ATP-binding cassette subfamily B protein